MSLSTSIYHFIKPELTDSPPDITVMNPNWDAVDAELNSHEEQINNLGANKADLVNGKVPLNQLPNLEVPVQSVNNKTGAVVLTKSDVGLGSVDNTSDSTKNVLSATKLATARTINGVSFNGTANITIVDNTKAPTNHASSGTGYGVGNSSTYGHVKVRNDLVGTETSGVTVSPAQIKVLNDKLKYTVVTITASGNWTVPDGVTAIDVIAIDGGYGGAGGGAGFGGNWDGSVGIHRGYGGNGGSSGNIKKCSCKTRPGAVLNVVIGAGGGGAFGSAASHDQSWIGCTAPGSTIITQLIDIFTTITGPEGGRGKNNYSAAVEAETFNCDFIANNPIVLGGGGYGGGNGGTGAGNGGTGAGNGGAVGGSQSKGANGGNATTYGCGGGGSGGAGYALNSSSGWLSNSASKGGDGKQGVVYIGYYNF